MLFVLSSGLLFNKKFRDNAFLVVMAGLLAVISTYFLGEQMQERSQQAVEAIKHLIKYAGELKSSTAGQAEHENRRDTQISIKKPSKTQKTPEASAVATSAAFILDCDECPPLVPIPSGQYRIGSEKGEPGHEVTEEPITPISIAKSFAIGQYKVTFAQWDACAAAGGCKYKPDDAGWGRGDRPVLNVSWDDTHDYISWLRTITKKHYRLPSEAEWEYAARAGSQGAYFWGEGVSPSQANYNNPNGTVPVGMYQKNKFGLYQVHGNLGEWVEDCWRENHYKIPNDGTAYKPADCENHVVRGGYWAFGPERIRAASRGSGERAARTRLFGFRVARDL